MTSSPLNLLNRVTAVLLIGLGLAIGAMGLYVGEADDAPGAALIGGLLMALALVLGVKAARDRLSPWTARTAVVLGVVLAAFAAFLTTEISARAVLFPPVEQVPPSVGMAPPPRYAAAVERARGLVRAAIAEQNLPGVSVAVGAGGAVVWTEGFGWRDVGTRTPVTPDTRFHIGTAASAVMPAVASLGLTHTGTDAPKEWSPEAIGEEGEDAPPLTFLRHTVLQPLGLMPPEYPLPGDRATFYVPRSGNDPRRGRRLMYMRDLACCANGMAFSSTPSDLVRFALSTNAGSFNGELAGGQVMSLTAIPATGIVVAVTSNIAHANTSSLAAAIAAAFAAGQ
jgi:CubicO group peptidase (beta-lactamase class C family)